MQLQEIEMHQKSKSTAGFKGIHNPDCLKNQTRDVKDERRRSEDAQSNTLREPTIRWFDSTNENVARFQWHCV